MWRIAFPVISSALICLAKEEIRKPVQYTTENFSAEVPKNHHFIMFYAPWCGHCSKLAPTWEELASTFHKGSDPDVIIGKVDCTVETALCSENDVTGYPTLKFFKIGESEGVKFRGTRDVSSLTSFIYEQLGITPEEPEGKPDVPEPVGGLYELTEDSFSKHTERGKHFVKFYAPWCGHCQKLAPVWDSLAKSLEHDKMVSVAKIDCTVHRTVCNNFDIKGYPTLLWIEDGKKVEKYQGQRTHEELKEFVARMIGDEDADAHVVAEQPVISYSADNFEHGIAKGITFIKFFAPWCGHCKRLAPTWEELGKKFVGTDVKIVKVDCTLDNSKELCGQEEVNGFPTLFLYKDGKKVEEYSGSRSLEDLYDFVSRHREEGAKRDEL
ncbi:thioredoxin domain-containing protein 5 homolog [Bacillus rossius redtenbacheri]|uniref:thioredoxin domain-containing protein 5 homolog n=1 Tax=Bacillus rossius redtenbacheri TaxID=93214 RepID=UPI002FDD3A4F